MKLQLNARQAQKKSEAKALRRSGQIPAVIYSEGKEGQAVAVSEHDFTTALDHVKAGHLPTTVFELTGEAGNVRTTNFPSRSTSQLQQDGSSPMRSISSSISVRS